LEDLGVHFRIIIKYILKKSGVSAWTEITWLLIQTIGGASECLRNELLGLMKGGAFLAWLRASQVLCCVEVVGYKHLPILF
jgi:hypothetical protein